MESSTYTDKKFIAASRGWVNVAAHEDVGHEVDAVISSKKVTVCEHYWNVPCKSHQSSYHQTRGKFGEIKTVPVTILCAPNGKELDRIQGGKGASELLKPMEKAFEQVPGEKIGAVEWTQAVKLVAEGDAAFEKGEWKKSVDAFVRVSKLPKKALKDLSSAGIEKLEAKGRELIEDANQKLGEPEEKRKLLAKVATEFKPLSCSKEAATALKDMPPDKK